MRGEEITLQNIKPLRLTFWAIWPIFWKYCPIQGDIFTYRFWTGTHQYIQFGSIPVCIARYGPVSANILNYGIAPSCKMQKVRSVSCSPIPTTRNYGTSTGNDPAGEQQQTGTVDELVLGAEICRYGSFCDEADKMLKDKVLDGFSSAPLT